MAAPWRDYQFMTTVAKRVGGPKMLALIVGVSGYVTVRGGEAGMKSLWNGPVQALKRRMKPFPTKGQVFEVTADGTQDDLVLRKGQSYRVLEGDGEAVLIEAIGDKSNPYVAPVTFLASVSDYPASDEGSAESTESAEENPAT